MKKFKLLLIVAVLSFGGCFVDEGARMANQVGEQTLNGANAVQQYEWFKRTEQNIKARYKQEETARKAIAEFIEMLPTDKSKWSDSDKGEIQRLRMTLDGISMSIDDMVADYNARSNMTNRNIFKENLPTNIFRGVNQALDFKYETTLSALPKGTN